jgi:hypothetical protein
VVVQQLERAIDAGAPDRPLAPARAHAAQTILDLQGAQGTVLPGEQIDQPFPGGAPMVAGPAQYLPRMHCPFSACLVLHAAKHNPRPDATITRMRLGLNFVIVPTRCHARADFSQHLRPSEPSQ